MKITFKKIQSYIVTHKIISTIITIAIVYVGYKYFFGTTGAQTLYTIEAAEKGTIVSTVTGSGQVSASNQIELKSKASGNIVSINATVGQEVPAGATIAQVDARDALLDLENAKIAYEKLTKVADQSDIESAKNAVNEAYNDGWDAVSGAFLKFPDIVSGMDDLFYSTSGYLNDARLGLLTQEQQNYRLAAGLSFDNAKKEYETVLIEYNSLSRLSGNTKLKKLVDDTYTMTNSMAEALKNAQNAISYISKDKATGATTAATNVNGWLTTVNSNLSSVLSSRSSITTKDAALTKLIEGADSLDIRSQQLSLQQKQNAYQDYFITAPFDGVIAKLNVKKTDAVSNGTSIATFITKQKTAIISVNEVDAAKIQVGNKVTLTFDAIDGLTLTGKVAEIDLVGTVSQGVVSYSVTISFDSQDDRVKSGMSVSASIATAVVQDAVTVPNSAVKIQGGTHYVEMFDTDMPITAQGGTGSTSNVAPRKQTVEVGISDDLSTQIISGLKEGDTVVTKTTTGSKTTTTAAPSLFGTGRPVSGGAR